ncbi:MAG: hypothetical protein DIZ80_13035 [endosymbiont of Galathealinum brachiosum]|uniref:TIGR03016 family PEP-CTERM system-associated outer membrane protein n=1 Tax=endosymbiont of Galathealinum brachiosum TaxID=2200906 RepID=A0A370D7Y7_9GAMM|nr:MAG: hypothetical protein DIZ80_13035 [endosymbiont of Galathealinum brachiosum]
MSFKLKLFQIKLTVLSVCVFSITTVNAAEWKVEPSIFLKALYNDNVRMRPDNSNPESSTGFTFEPRVKFSGEEQRVWDVAIDARGKVTQYQDVEDADSDNAFFIFDGGRQTERSNWRLNTSFQRNSNFDTDFDTESPDAGLLDDHTERKTASVSPSVRWSLSETSQISFSLNNTNVAYDEKTNLNYEDYDYDSASFNSLWIITQSHQVGFTGSYSEYDSPDAGFSYDQSILQVDYTYTINQISDVSLSVGGRRLESLIKDQLIGCELINTATGENFGVEPIENYSNGLCPPSFLVLRVIPIFDDVKSKDDGTVVNLSYSSKSETTSHNFTGGRTVIPSSFGGAQEKRSATYQFSIKNTERFSTSFILNAYKTETISGVDSSNDRTRYRFEPSVRYKLNKNWNLDVLYRYIEQNISNSDEGSSSNAVYVNLNLHWPKLASTY